MLATLVLLYLVCTVCIGLWASRKVKIAEDFALAGRRLPLHLCTSAFFATWFGAETILGASSRFAQQGMRGIIEDPLGASLCLILVGLFFVKHLYPKGYISIGDFFKEKYGRGFEFFSSILQALSYFTYTSAQFVALALVLHTVLPLPFFTCLFAGSLLVVFYTFFGGMWAVALTDFVQTIVIVVGLGGLALFLNMEGDTKEVPFFSLLQQQNTHFLPKSSLKDWGSFLAAWMVMGFGSIPSQDVFQRVMSAKSEKVARQSAIAGGLLYLLVALLPLYIVAVCLHKHGEVTDTQQIIPQMVMMHTPLAIQALFFGALISAIMSTASASLLAQATVIGENLVKPYLKHSSDAQMLFIFRGMVFWVSLVSIGIAMVYKDIFFLTSLSSSIVLVTLFVPMAFGVFWSPLTSLSAYLSASMGLIVYLLGYWMELDLMAVFWGFIASLSGFLMGLLLKKK